ncbi:MAG: hypothetical protein MK212_14650 [Saprospiraceae bacterium]|nr:hypothetical protein [Saprospiraceae bacterium]
MKHCYMIEFELPKFATKEFTEQMQAHDLVIEKWKQEGILETYCMAHSQAKFWAIMKASSEFEIMSIIEELPMSNFMIPCISALSPQPQTQTQTQTSLGRLAVSQSSY